MNVEPTHPLTDEQRDGTACVTCGRDTAAMRPVGHVNGVQVFACASHDATWPNGEPAGVRDLARRLDIARRADRLAAQLERDFGNVRDERLAEAVRATIEAMRALSAAGHAADEEMIWRTAEHAHAALTRCVALVAEIEQRAR